MNSFLGKVIRLTEGHRAKVEEKPEVRKAGGVYYTPTYIVDYIVKNTVGKLCERKTPRQISSLRILDPACGSGSFLLGAYQYLLDYHRDWYEKDGPRKHTQEIYQGYGGQWHLTTRQKKRILLNNIHGVDIDPQAVEVTKLSLLLKVMEGENQDTLEKQMKLFKERALPDLGSNIKCGNSLIGPDFYQGKQMNLLDNEEVYRINAFNWEKEFPEIMKGGGFDTVIGNPPYIRIQTMKEWAPSEVEIYKEHYTSASKGNYDIYVVFVERGMSLLNKSGRLGFILPHKFFNAQYGEALRALLSKGKHLAEVVHFGDHQVFAGATNYTCLLFLDKAGKKQCHFVKVDDLRAWRNAGEAVEGIIPSSRITATEWNFSVGKSAPLLEKLSRMTVKLGSVARIFQGLVTGADKVFVLEETAPPKSGSIRVKDQDGIDWLLEREILRPFLNNVTVSTFERPVSHHWLIFPYRLHGKKADLMQSEEISNSYPQTWDYLKDKSGILRGREGGKWNHERWYAFGRNQNLTEMEERKLMVQVISREGRYAYDDMSIYFTGGGNGPYYGVRWGEGKNPHSLYYLQGLLNSRLLDSYLHQISSPFRGGYWSYGKRFIAQLPIHTINFSDPTDKARHDQMVKLVEQMLSLHRQLAASKTPDEKTRIQRQIDATDQQIDHLAYELYGLTEKEIQIVEGGK